MQKLVRWEQHQHHIVWGPEMQLFLRYFICRM
jgi:hypothetical protein